MKKILKSLVMITVMALVLTAFTACELNLESIKDKVQSIIGGEQPVCVHEIVTDEAVDPTCTETGLTEGYHCGKCGEVILKQFTVKALGHKKGTAATCTEAAICSVCGEHYGDPAGHQFADATCSVPATCVVCGEVEGEVNPDNHDFTDATCTDPQVCKDCGAEGEPALGHTWADATCTAPKTCSVCGETEGDPLGHTFTEFVTVLPTADAPGYTKGVCSVEGCEGHKFDEVKAMGDGTYVLTQEGVAHLTASGMAYDGQVVVLNDVFAVHLSGKYRTDGGQNKEFNDGFLGTSRMNWGGGTAFDVEGMKLIRNGIEFTTLNETTVVIHWVCGGNDRQIALYDMEGNVVVKSEDATLKNGLYVSEFVVPAGSYVLGNVGGSNYYFGVSVKVAPHVHSYTETVKAPTCTEAGYITHECACGDKYTDTPVDALGHDYVDGYCTRCQAEQPAEETTVEIKVDTPYYISSAMSTGELYFSGSCTKGRLDGTNDIAKAVAVMLEAGETEGQYYIYFMNGEVKTYIALTGTKGTNRFSLTETKDATCLWTVDTTAKTIVSATTTDRGFATQVASTYYNFSTYSTQNLNSTDYDWSWFVPVE